MQRTLASLPASILENGSSRLKLMTLSSPLEHIPLALVQEVAFTQENIIIVSEYLQLLAKSDQDVVDLLMKEFERVGRDSETPRTVTEMWILSFEQIQWQKAFASELLSLMSFSTGR